VRFVEPGFHFAKKIEFRYYAVSLDRKWKSQWQQSVYLPQRKNEKGKLDCRSGIQLQALNLEAR